MVGQDAVLEFRFQHRREAGDRPRFFPDHLRSHHDMPQELPIIRIIVLWEQRKLLCLSNIMAERSRNQKISLQNRICAAEIFAHSGHAERMLQKATHKAMVYRLRCGRRAESLNKSLVLHKKAFQ